MSTCEVPVAAPVKLRVLVFNMQTLKPCFLYKMRCFLRRYPVTHCCTWPAERRSDLHNEQSRVAV